MDWSQVGQQIGSQVAQHLAMAAEAMSTASMAGGGDADGGPPAPAASAPAAPDAAQPAAGAAAAHAHPRQRPGRSPTHSLASVHRFITRLQQQQSSDVGEDGAAGGQQEDGAGPEERGTAESDQESAVRLLDQLPRFPHPRMEGKWALRTGERGLQLCSSCSAAWGTGGRSDRRKAPLN